MPIIKVLLADDHALVIEGIKAVLEKKAPDIQVIGEAANGNQVLELAKKTPVDVYVLDISMPMLNGLETAARLLRKDKKRKIIILSMYDDRATIEKALRVGVRGYLIKESVTEDIARAVYAVHRGNSYLSPSISDSLINNMLDESRKTPKMSSPGGLTSREMEIIQLIAEGWGNKQIAYKLKISKNTVHVHRHNIAVKLDIHKQTELVRYAIKAGIIKL